MNDKPNWSWSEPQKPRSTVIQRADKGNIVIGPNIYLVDDGDLIVTFPHMEYLSDAVSTVTDTFVMRSSDGGASWTRSKQLPADFFEREDHYWRALRLPDGTLLRNGSYGWENFPDTPEKRKELTDQGYYLFTPEQANAADTISIIHRVWMCRSRDNGKTWQKREIDFPMFIPHLAAYGDPIVTRDGTFISPMWGRFDLETEPRNVSSLALRTSDAGESWSFATIAQAGQGPDDFAFNETSITQASNGDIVAVMRTTAQIELWGAVSSDDGKTWSQPFDTGMRGSTPAVVTTTDGLVVAVYSRREHTSARNDGLGWPRTGMYACVSRDHGQSWDAQHQVMLLDAGTETLDGYPTAVPLPDGSVYTVYGFHGASAIGGTRFHPLHDDFVATAAAPEDQSPAGALSQQQLEAAEQQFQLDRRDKLSDKED